MVQIIRDNKDIESVPPHQNTYRWVGTDCTIIPIIILGVVLFCIFYVLRHIFFHDRDIPMFGHQYKLYLGHTI